MKNLKISAKLILGFAIVALLTAFVGIFGAVMLLKTDTNYSNMIVTNNTAVMSLADLREAFQLERVAMRNVVIAVANGKDSVAEAVEVAKSASSVVVENIADYEKTVVDRGREAPFFTAKESYEGAFSTAKSVVFERALAGDMKGAIEALKSTANAAGPIAEGLAKTVDICYEVTDELSVELTNASIMTSNIQIVMSVLAFIIAMVLGIYISRSISGPIKKMLEAANLISVGNMDVDAKYVSKDEVGQLSVAFSKMVDSINLQVATVTSLAEGDLTVNIHPRCPEDTMGFGLEKLVGNLNNMFGEINNATAQVSTGSKQIADGAQTLAQGSTEQAAAVEQLSSSISEIADKTQENSNKAAKAADLSLTIRNNAQKGSEQMDHMMQAVKDINEASQSINKVIKVIDDIAFQTNILALNAAVEAARAGQHGKGFAVVAEEVRNLAAKSASAAKDTGSLIANSMEKAQLGAKIAGQTAESLADIVTGINESSLIITDIAKSSEEQSAGIRQINTGIDQVAQVIQQNSATAEESAAASEEMSGQSEMLQELVSQYKTKNSSTLHLSAGRSSGSAKRKVEMPEKTSSSMMDDFGKY